MSSEIAPELADELWRMNIDQFAARVSRGYWKDWPYLRWLSRNIQQTVTAGDGRLIVNMPPRHGKSQLVSKWLPVWFLEWFPEKSVFIVSYEGGIARDYGRAVRDEFMNSDLTLTKVRSDASGAGLWLTEQGGMLLSTGVGGPLINRGADLIIIDDPHKNWDEVHSTIKRNSLINWFDSTLMSRLEPGGSVLLSMHRWADVDLTAYLEREHGDKWSTLRLPAIAEEDDPIGREPGQALCPDRFTAQHLGERQKAMADLVWCGMWQQRPAADTGNLWKRDWFRYWSGDAAELRDDPKAEWIQSWDMSFKGGQKSDYVVGQVWCKTDGRMYLVDQVREKATFTETVQLVRNLSARYPYVNAKLIESAANGPAIISQMGKEIPGMIPVTARGSKQSRATAASPFLQAGNVYIPDPTKHRWAGAYINECCTFPNAANDDQVDATSQALLRFSTSSWQLLLGRA